MDAYFPQHLIMISELTYVKSEAEKSALPPQKFIFLDGKELIAIFLELKTAFKSQTYLEP